jgi:hypothetical protein
VVRVLRSSVALLPEGRQYWCHLSVRRGLGGSEGWSSPSSISLFGLCLVRWFVAAAGCM